MRNTSPAHPESGSKTYVLAQYARVMDLEDMAEHMSAHDSKYNKGDVMAVLTQMASCLREQLLLGNKVKLGDLGAFSPILRGSGAIDAESFSPAMIDKVTVRWNPGPDFVNMRNDAQLQFVGTRKSQVDARKVERERLNAMASGQPGTDDPDTGESGSGDELGQ